MIKWLELSEAEKNKIVAKLAMESENEEAFCSDLNRAMDVAAKLGEAKFVLELTRRTDGAHFAVFKKTGPMHTNRFETQANHKNPCEAICLAALAALGHDIDLGEKDKVIVWPIGANKQLA